MARSKQSRRVVAALFVLAFVNLAAAAAYMAARRKTQKESAAVIAEDPKKQVARAARAAGLIELERNNFDAAARSFAKAIEFGGANPEVAELLRITTQLRDNANQAQPETIGEVAVKVAPDKAEPEAPAPAAGSMKTGPERGAPEKRRDPKEIKRVKQSPPRASKRDDDDRGAVMITSTPSGLSVVLDGQTVGVTPMRFLAEPGTHAVELVSGRTSVWQKEVNVASGRVMSLDPEVDVPAQPPPPAPAPEPKPPTVAPPPAPPEPEPTQAPAEPAPAAKPGSLVVLANPSVAGLRVSVSELKAAFSGESTTINGSSVVLVMRPLASASSNALLGRMGMQQRSFKDQWNKMQYYGGRTPPRTIAALADIVRFVASTPGAVCPLLVSDLEDLPSNTLKRMPVN